jgi:hypothetical protein
MTEKSTCRKCGVEKDLNKFRARRSGEKVYVDKICMACKGTAWRAQMTLKLLEEFGGKCNCCGEEHPQFLTLEHIQGGGSYSYGRVNGRCRKNRQQVLREAEKDGWDRTKYELLCIGCNWAKGQFGQCPHRTGITKEQVMESLRQKAEGIGKNHPNPIRANQSAGFFKKGFDSRRVNAVLKEIEKVST